MNNDFTICIRKRPCFKDTDVVKTTLTTISVADEKVKINLDKYKEVKTFEFDNVYSEFVSTDFIHQKNIQTHLNANNDFICYTFGETGSGKTHTLFGPSGLIELTITALITAHAYVSISSYEIYRDQLYDLLNRKAKLNMLEQCGNIHIQNLTWHECNNGNVTKALEIIKKNRRVGESSENNQSSRSHCLVHMKANNKNFIFVDLAGSEKANKSICTNRKEYHEMAGINLDILALKECIRHIKNDRSRIPFRSTKLTMALRESFYDQYKALMIVTISPESTNAKESLNILSYASDFKSVKRKPKIEYFDEPIAPYQPQKSPAKKQVIASNLPIIHKVRNVSTPKERPVAQNIASKPPTANAEIYARRRSITPRKNDINDVIKLPDIVVSANVKKAKLIKNPEFVKKDRLVTPPILNTGIGMKKYSDTKANANANAHAKVDDDNDAYDNEVFESENEQINQQNKISKVTEPELVVIKKRKKLTHDEKCGALHDLIMKEINVYHDYVSQTRDDKDKATEEFGSDMADILFNQVKAIKKIDKNFCKKFFLMS